VVEPGELAEPAGPLLVVELEAVLDPELGVGAELEPLVGLAADERADPDAVDVPVEAVLEPEVVGSVVVGAGCSGVEVELVAVAGPLAAGVEEDAGGDDVVVAGTTTTEPGMTVSVGRGRSRT
jgi:hypothetical protein